MNTGYEDKMIFNCNQGTVEQCLAALKKLTKDDRGIVLKAKRDSRFGDNLLIAISLLK